MFGSIGRSNNPNKFKINQNYHNVSILVCSGEFNVKLEYLYIININGTEQN